MTAHTFLPWFVANPNKAIEAYKSRTHYVVVDLETTNADKGSALNYDNHIVVACWYVVKNGRTTKKHKVADEYDLKELEDDIRAAQFVVAHNAKFECQWFHRMGIDLRDILLFDTFLAEWVILSNRSMSMRDLSLDTTTVRYGLPGKQHVAGTLLHMGVCPSVMPKQWVVDYCFDDVELTFNLFNAQLKVLERDSLFHLVLVRNLCCTCLAEIEFNGCELDGDEVNKEFVATRDEYERTLRELSEFASGIKLRSPKSLIEFLYGKLGFTPPVDPRTKKPYVTGKGQLSVNSDILSKLTAKTEEQKRFLGLYKKVNKLSSLLTKNLLFFKGVVDEYDSVYYGVLNQGSTGTGRLSSSGRTLEFKLEGKSRGVQLQNLPRAYKRLFFAQDPDWLVGEADGSQLEFRVGADQGHDEVAKAAIENGEDIHSDTAAVLIAEKEEGFVGLSLKDARQPAKPQTFAPIKYSGLVWKQTLKTVLTQGKSLRDNPELSVKGNFFCTDGRSYDRRCRCTTRHVKFVDVIL